MDARAAEAEEESSAEALERAVSRIVCSQAALELGFSAARASALDLLVAALHRFLAESAHRAHEAAESAGRASTALPDVLRALAGGEGMGVDIAQLIDHVRACAEGEAREVPFAQPLGSYPARKRLRGGGGALTYAEVAGAAAPPHLPLPSWLPVLPEAHTYVRSAQHAAAQTLEAAARDGRVKRELAAQTVGAEAALSALADAQAPGCATDYAATAPGRWGGALGGGRALALRAAAEQETALAEAEPEAAARNPYVRAAGRGGAALDAGYTAELLQGVGGAAPAASALALPAAGEGEAGWAGEGGGAGAQAARALLTVDAFSLHSGRRAAAAARAARAGPSSAPPQSSFHALVSRRIDSLHGLEAETQARAGKEAARLAKIIERDPHATEILEDVDDLLLQARGV